VGEDLWPDLGEGNEKWAFSAEKEKACARDQLKRGRSGDRQRGSLLTGKKKEGAGSFRGGSFHSVQTRGTKDRQP